MENLCSPFPPHRCLSSLKAELASPELGVDSHLGGLSWQDGDSAGISARPSVKSTGPRTAGRWLLSPCTFFPKRDLLEGRKPEGARGAATLRVVRKKLSQLPAQGSLLIWPPGEEASSVSSTVFGR